MAGTNLYQDLNTALGEFYAVLDKYVPIVGPAIKALEAVIPPLADLITQLSALMVKLDAEITNLDVANIPGLSDKLTKVSEFMQAAETLLTTAEKLLPNDTAAIEQALGVIAVAKTLPTLAGIKDTIHELIGKIITDLNQLKA